MIKWFYDKHTIKNALLLLDQDSRLRGNDKKKKNV